MASDLIKILSDADFKETLSAAGTPVLVDFYADWCGPCKMIAPVLDELAGEYQGKIQIAKISVDQNRIIPAEFKVSSIPTLIVFKEGSEVERLIGYKSKKELKAVLDKYI